MPNYMVVYVVHYDWTLYPEDRPNAMFFEVEDIAFDYYDDLISQLPGLTEIHQYEFVDGKYMLRRKWTK